jgi:signal transduction histidine kinase
VTTLLLLALEGLILSLCALDAARHYDFLGFGSRLTIALLAAAGAMVPWFRPAADPRRRPGVAGILGITVLAMTVIALAAERTTANRAAGWGAGARDRLDRRATLLQDDFTVLVSRMTAPLGEPPPGAGGRAPLFDHLARLARATGLPAHRFGLSAYDPGGALLAWAGNSSPPPRHLMEEPAGDLHFAIGGLGVQPRLFAVRGAGAIRLAAEYALLPIAASGHAGDDAGIALDVLPHWDTVAPAHIHLSDPRDAADLARFFSGRNDRDWGPDGARTPQSVAFPLRALSGEPVAIVSIRDKPPAPMVDGIRRTAARLAACVAALGILIAWRAARRRRGVRPWPAAAAGIGALLAARTALLLIGPAADLPDTSLFDVTLYSSSLLGPYSRSPADLLLTAGFGFATVLLLRRAARAAGTRRRAIPRLVAGTIVLVVLLGAGLHYFLDRLVVEVRLDLTEAGIATLSPAALALQVGLYLLLVASGVLVGIPVDFIRRARTAGRPGPAPFGARAILRGAAWVVLPTLAAILFLNHAYARLRRDFFEHDLLPRVVEQEARRRQVIRDALETMSEPGFAAAAGLAPNSREAGGAEADVIAYRLWSATPLAARGLASSLQVFDPSGRHLGRFSVTLAPSLDVPFERAVAAAGHGVIELPPDPEGPLRQPVIGGARWLRAAGGPALLIVLSATDAYDNLALIGSESVYVDLFRAPGAARSNPELLRDPPAVSVFGADLQRLYDSSDPVPPPPPKALDRLRAGSPVWSTGLLGGVPARILYARGPREIFALAHPRPGRADLVASFLRLALLYGTLAGVALLLARGARLAIERRRPRLPAPAFGRRLVTVLLVTGLVPLLSFAWVVSRLIGRDIDRELVTSGLGTLQVVRRMAEDYLQVGDPEVTALDDDVVFWLSGVVRQDINIYREGALLATSTRELYSSGLLNTRLDGEAYRALVLERAPYVVIRPAGGPLRHVTLGMTLRIDRAGSLGVIAVPLRAQGRAAAAKEAEVADALLIMTCLAVGLLTSAGVAMGRRVAGPVSLLARGARRLAAGDLQARVPARGSDETALLIASFNSMAESLERQRDALNRRREYIETILRSATAGVISVDDGGTITTINPAAQSFLQGARGAPEAGTDWDDWIGGDPGLGPLREAWEGAGAAGVEREAEIVIGPQERERRLRVVFIPFAARAEAPPDRIILIEDITEIVQSGRLAAWAEMARRVAHEVKNPLTPIQLSVEHVRRLLQSRDPRLEMVLPDCLDNIQRQVGALRQIATEFSAYARLPELRPEPIAPAALIEAAAGPYISAAPPGVSVVLRTDPGLPDVEVDRAVMVRALVNLIENALQAMPEGGRIEIEATTSPADDGAGWVRVLVRDTGVGVAPELLPRLFEPYFSTRSGGTGLGLALARKAIEEHGGTISLSSRVGEGTVVTLTLPVAGGGRTGP